ncbi:cyclase family protein [Halodesulfovibrio sp.]|jgi:kynurenine formamidase|uniref:cyclase family protein n=1 Tax=Halodesulfovibrio sp. TaxID=1912772 RepID=UPI0025DA3149|nr:cyclase family protein [Halodesulfovibrio sp.]MCT4628076.1 cyclase family protein [Halodesulfovibrio sp.]
MFNHTNVIDLTHTITNGMPVYPGTSAPRIAQSSTVSQNGFAEKELTLCSHVGTHMDAPAHIINNAETLDALPTATFIGSACLLDVSSASAISLDILKKHERTIAQCDFVIFASGHEKYWGTETYFSPFPVLDKEAATWLTTQKLKGVGIDAISFDTMDASELFIHTILLSHGLVLIENLTNLASITESMFTFAALPLKIHESDGAPVRAIAILP